MGRGCKGPGGSVGIPTTFMGSHGPGCPPERLRVGRLWQGMAARHSESKNSSVRNKVSPLSDSSCALRSQGGSGAGMALSACPTCRVTKITSHLFRVLLLHRLQFASSLNRAYLPVWPSHSTLLASPSSVRTGWGSRKKGVRIGECRRPHLSRSRWARVNECGRPRPRLDGARSC